MSSKHHRLLRTLVLWLFALLSASLAATPSRAGELQEDLARRRARVLEALGPEAMLILWSAPVQTYSHDIEHEYRQDSNLYYLTGIEQEGTALVLMPGNETRREILFLEPRDPAREHWRGHMLETEEATAQSGIDTVYSAAELESFVNDVLSGRPYDVPRYRASSEYDRFIEAVRKKKARLAVVLGEPSKLSSPLSAPMAFAQKVRERFLGVTVEDASEILFGLRQVKTPYERRILKESADIAVEGHLAGMRVARPGIPEYEVEAAIEAVYKRRGAHGPSYPSIVASGPNATILHYWRSRRLMEPGDLLLVDSGANYGYQTVDITRTYPVDGTFTSRQKDLYRIVLAAQDAGIETAGPGVTLDDIHLATVAVIKKGLHELGLITDLSGDQYRTWYTHGACHWIGIDVHDVGSRDRPLEPGMAFVIEPGLYIREAAFDRLPRTEDAADFERQVRPAFQKYKDIGIRIEDSFLVTHSGIERLSAGVPRTVEEIERFLSVPRVSSTSSVPTTDHAHR